MSPALVIRAATHDDIDAIAGVCTRSARRAYTGLVTEDYVDRVIRHFFEPERLSREVLPSGEWFGFMVAQSGDAIVGVSGTGLSAHGGSACELFALYVDPSCQRRGVGRALLADSVAQAEGTGATELDVSVLPGNAPAVRFYEACGFQPAGEREIYAPHGKDGGPDVALVYTLRISDVHNFRLALPPPTFDALRRS